MNNHSYNNKLQPFANNNRKSMTKSEACAWKYLLRNRQMKGYQFRRQRPIGRYIVDFVCLPLKLIVEVDGITHDSPEAILRDDKRDSELSDLGFTTLRFSSWEILNRMVDVDIIIGKWIDENAISPPPLPRKRNKGKTPNKLENPSWKLKDPPPSPRQRGKVVQPLFKSTKPND